jgi:antitoxin (DNA-binding transcriptional repressor) of toxin-antitoxin stability system
MQKTINSKELRTSLPEIVESVKRGERFTVMYRSRPAFRIVPLEEEPIFPPLSEDPLYRAGAVGESSDNLTGVDHDSVLYGKCR